MSTFANRRATHFRFAAILAIAMLCWRTLAAVPGDLEVVGRMPMDYQVAREGSKAGALSDLSIRMVAGFGEIAEMKECFGGGGPIRTEFRHFVHSVP